ncbi:hypothetical protein D3C78_1942400 [compost metagenome]
MKPAPSVRSFEKFSFTELIWLLTQSGRRLVSAPAISCCSDEIYCGMRVMNSEA